MNEVFLEEMVLYSGASYVILCVKHEPPCLSQVVKQICKKDHLWMNTLAHHEANEKRSLFQTTSSLIW